MEEGAILLDTRLRIGFVNPKILDLLGYEEKELIDQSIKKIIPKDLLWVWSEITERSQRESFRFESPLVNKDGDEIPVMVTASSIKIETRRSEFLCTIIDLTEQKEKEDKLKEEMLKFRIRRGTANIILEKGYNKAADVLSTLRRFGHNIIFLSRRSNREALRHIINEKEDRVLWLEGRDKGPRSVEPTTESLLGFFEKKVDRATVLVLDRIDYLISKMGFKVVIDMMHDMVEMFYHRKAILLILIDPATVTDQQLGQLEKDAPVLEAKMGLVLPDELQEILLYVSQQNRMDRQPSYKDIGKRFNITKTTTRKRIHQLQILDLLLETKRGRTKVLKVSDKGYRYVLAQSSRIG
jgi:PAS domain S-box-containing protein